MYAGQFEIYIYTEWTWVDAYIIILVIFILVSKIVNIIKFNQKHVFLVILVDVLFFLTVHVQNN